MIGLLHGDDRELLQALIAREAFDVLVHGHTHQARVGIPEDTGRQPRGDLWLPDRQAYHRGAGYGSQGCGGALSLIVWKRCECGRRLPQDSRAFTKT